jgi:phosphoglycolate phosphatase
LSSSHQDDDNFIGEFLTENGMTSYFDRIMGNAVHKSKEEKIKTVFAEYGTDASECIFVTDTLGDIREATKVNVGAIGVTWGFHERERLAQGKPFGSLRE